MFISLTFFQWIYTYIYMYIILILFLWLFKIFYNKLHFLKTKLCEAFGEKELLPYLLSILKLGT